MMDIIFLLLMTAIALFLCVVILFFVFILFICLVIPTIETWEKFKGVFGR